MKNRTLSLLLASVVAVSAMLFGKPSSISAQTWPNEPVGSTNLLDCSFSGSVCGMMDVYKSATYTTIADAPTGGTKQVLDTYLAANTGYGSGTWVYSLPAGTREVFVGTWWKTNPEFQGLSVNTNKMIFITGPGNNSLMSWHGAQDQPKTLVWYNQTITNNCHVSGWSGGCWPADGTGWFLPNGSSNGVVAAGSGWHRIEIYQKASTTDTSRDGIIRWWLDGVLVGNYPNVNYSSQGFTDVQYNHTWDGSVATVAPYRDMSRSWHHYWDHLRISIPNGAPAIMLITTGSLPSARTGTPYTATLTASEGKAPYSWFVESGNLPAGLSLNASTGRITGSPTTVGKSTFTIRVTDANQPALTTSKSFYIITSGTSGIIREELAVSGLRLTAEPRKGRVLFRAALAGSYSLIIHDLTGREVWRHAGDGEAVWNHQGNLNRGIYIARFSQGNQKNTVRFNVMS